MGLERFPMQLARLMTTCCRAAGAHWGLDVLKTENRCRSRRCPSPSCLLPTEKRQHLCGVVVPAGFELYRRLGRKHLTGAVQDVEMGMAGRLRKA